MWTVGPIGFAAPALLIGLLALPILYVLLRAVPPAPIRRAFPGVALLLGLQDDESQTDRTPWWLLVLRMLAVAAMILGFAGPVLNPTDDSRGTGPLLILVDGSWADARDWPRRLDRIEGLLADAARDGRQVDLISLTDLPAEGPNFVAADAITQRLPGFTPNAWAPNADAIATWLATLTGDFETYWLSDGVTRDGRMDLLSALETHGTVTAYQSNRPVLALRPARFEDGVIKLTAARAVDVGAATARISTIGLDPAGRERSLAQSDITWQAGELEAELDLSLPPELRNRITRFELTGLRSAGAVTLTDDALKRREVALIAGGQNSEEIELLSPLHYLEQALIPTADLINGTLDDVLLANPDVIILADVAGLSFAEETAMLDWLDQGGLLLRFAGPRLAASDISRVDEDPLMPVRLRAGGRTVGGAMSWGEPKALAPFAQGSPFFGLPVPEDVTVTAQIVAQPDPTLSDRVIAQLADGTPLVTQKSHGQGQIVLVHVTANAEWSNLPLSGLFVQMLERLAVSTRPAAQSAEDLAGTSWSIERVLTGFGDVEPAETRPGVTGERLALGQPDADLPPGIYAGEDRRIAVNTISHNTDITPAIWPDRIRVEGLGVVRETLLKGWLLIGALALLALDILASLALSGKLRGPRLQSAVVILAALSLAPDAQAQSDDIAIRATSEVVLAHVLTGNSRIDEAASRGLFGLSDTLYRRTSVEPAAPIGVNIETDELSFFPLLYWPISPDQALPSRDAYAKLNRYLQTGGMILFDTRDANIAGFGGASPEGRHLQAIARSLDIPALEPIPSDHVLTRSFYLLQDFPGRYASRDVWVEAAPPGATQTEGMPFRDLNDGVTPIVIGGNDWAAAWAIDETGNRMFPVGRGMAGERQREIALRFGVNLVMHVLTGNYKSDQVHVPDLLDRLGQ
ncbi:DUF4159 domain-containing protein [Aestuariibius sp. HNIBRBA575]|uniref:DUF4159 domain-containing protein n=1 Tax=Aestuariibius sp. HNIBRBA575 TaxID=3233343 RepID=UPI0034A291E0